MYPYTAYPLLVLCLSSPMFMCTILATSCTPSSTREHAHIHVHAHTVHMPSALNHCPSHSPSIFSLILGKYFSSSPLPLSLFASPFFFFFFNNLSYFLFSLNLWSKIEAKQNKTTMHNRECPRLFQFMAFSVSQ